jgi:hypothetical protein
MGYSLEDQVRQAIERSGKSRYWLWKQTQIDQSALSKFVAGKAGLSVQSVNALLDALGLEVKLVKKK